MISGGPGKTGSCCRKDDEWDAWCGAVRRMETRGWAGAGRGAEADIQVEGSMLEAWIPGGVG